MGIQQSKPNMIFFRGRLTVNPNTLNNQIHTYFFAHYWQQKHKEEMFQKQEKEYRRSTQAKNEGEALKFQEIKLQYTYDNWMKLIQSVAQFNRFYLDCYTKAYQNKPNFLPISVMDFRAFRLFHDWAVWGDSTSYTELQATGYFDSNNSNPIQPIEGQLYLTTKLGTNKCIMANQDTDSQDMPKLFALTMNLNGQLKLNVNPTVNRDPHFRTVDALPWTPSMGVHWYANGHLQFLDKQMKHCELNPNLAKLIQNCKPTWTQMRMLQYRYNHPTKVSSVVGYIMNTEDNSKGNLSYINIKWRIVKCAGKYNNPNPAKTYNGNTNDNTNIEIFLRNVTFGKDQRGILVDLSAAVMDANDQTLLPLLPTELKIVITAENTPLFKIDINLNQEQIAQIFHNCAGILLVKHPQKLPKGQPLLITMEQKLISKQEKFGGPIDAKFQGRQPEFNLEIKDKFLKTKELKNWKTLTKNCNEGNIDDKTNISILFQNFVNFELYLTSYGKPYTGSRKLHLSSSYNIDTSGLTQYTTIENYLEEHKLDPPEKRINQLIEDSQDFRTAYDSYDKVNQGVFQGKLNTIIELTNSYINKLYTPDGNNKYSLRYTFTKQKITKQFKLTFVPGIEENVHDVSFKDGHALIKVFLNQNLTEANNPRHPALESLCLVGTLQMELGDQETKKLETLTSFTTIFFQNPLKNPYDDIDWLNVVGPKLKLMGLLYPSMQNIIDLYNYDGLSMSAMKRAFEIEDENHSRYMPATREMSSVTHRQIRRWLYNPLYDAKIHVESNKHIHFKDTSLPFKCFDEGKNQLIELLKQAFKIELTTIPLYLSAMYSITKEGEATKLLRSVAKDEMKHLFIVSNLLNAVGSTPPYPIENQKTSQNIPIYPLDSQKELICFHFQAAKNQRWKDLMGTLPIQSSIGEQLLRFVMIEMPAEAYEINITPLFMSPFKKGQYLNFEVGACYDSLCGEESTRDKLLETASRIRDIRDAINAVVLEEQHKQDILEGRTSEKPQGEFLTIGMAYEKIMDYLWALNDLNSQKLFNGDSNKQFTYMYLQDMTEIFSLRTALEQIRLIVAEGEGSSLFSVTGEVNRESHFIKFIQIFTGCDLQIQSIYSQQKTMDDKYYKRTADFRFTPNYERFPNFPNYTNVIWTPQADHLVERLVESELKLERLSDRLVHTQFPYTYAPRSFLNGYLKILEEFGFIFSTEPTEYEHRYKKNFKWERLRTMENAIAKMRQMTLNANHIIRPNDTFDEEKNNKFPDAPGKVYPSASPNFNISRSTYLPRFRDPKPPKNKEI